MDRKFTVLLLVLYFAAADGGPLSDQPHSKAGHHSNDYDHEAFLGKDLKKTFDELTPEESLHLLGKLIDKIDKDGNGMVTRHELRNWIDFRMHHYIEENAQRQWDYLKTVAWHNLPIPEILANKTIDRDEPVSWEMLINASYSGNLTEAKERQMKRDQVRWTAADQDNDDLLSKEEFKAFVAPEGYDHTKVIYVKENLDEIDEDKDGFVSLEEFLGSRFVQATKESDPEQYKYEVKEFQTYKDKNKDGKLDMNEMWEVLLGPMGHDPAMSETKHLIRFADTNKDEMLSRQEILDNHDHFVGSSATNFGEDLPRHDEF